MTPFATAFCRTRRPLGSKPERDVGSVYEIWTLGMRWLRSAIALFRRSMPSVFVSERPSISMSIRLMP
jgi:hypothetical protein